MFDQLAKKSKTNSDSNGDETDRNVIFQYESTNGGADVAEIISSDEDDYYEEEEDDHYEEEEDDHYEEEEDDHYEEEDDQNDMQVSFKVLLKSVSLSK